MKLLYNKFAIACILFLSIVMVGCYKDKGNYDLHPINEISFVKGSGDTLEINQFDTLHVVPELEQSLDSGNANLSYKWSVYLYTPPITGMVDEVLDSTRVLNKKFGLKPNDYTLLLTVTDKNTGVPFFKKYFLRVSSVLSEGWLLISEDNAGNRDIDMLHPDGDVLKNILSTANPSIDLPKGIHTVRVLTTFFSSSQNIYILGDSQAIRVRYADFTKLNSLKDWFIQEPKPMHPEEYYFDPIGFNNVYIDNGRIFSGQIDFRFGVTVAGNHAFSKYLLPANGSDGAIIYDTINKRFYNYSQKKLNDFAPDSTAPFNMNNVGMDVVSAGFGPYGRYEFLMKDASGKPYILRFSRWGAEGKFLVDAAPKLLQATQYAFSGLYSQAYYAVGNEIYLLDIENNTAKLIYSFSSGENITTMRLKHSSSSFVRYWDNFRTLAVGTFNGTEGSVYTFSIDNVGAFENNTYSKVYSDLNKPINLVYKNRK